MEIAKVIRFLVLCMVIGGAIGRPFDMTAEGLLVGSAVAAVFLSLAENTDKKK